MIRRPLLTLAVAVLFAGASIALCVTRLHIDTSLASLFNENDASATALVRVLDHFRAVDELILIADGPPHQLIFFAQRLEQAISVDADASKLSDGLIYRVDDQTRAFFEQVLVPNGIFYLSEHD